MKIKLKMIKQLNLSYYYTKLLVKFLEDFNKELI